MEGKRYQANKGLIYEFANTPYWTELKAYLEDKKSRAADKLFSKNAASDSEILGAYHETKAERDQAQGIINYIEQIKLEIIEENKKKEKENGKKNV